MLLTVRGCSPDPVLLGLGLGGALEEDFTGGGELTGGEFTVVGPPLDDVVTGVGLFDGAMGAATEVGGETVPPAQSVALVAGPGPA